MDEFSSRRNYKMIYRITSPSFLFSFSCCLFTYLLHHLFPIIITFVQYTHFSQIVLKSSHLSNGCKDNSESKLRLHGMLDEWSVETSYRYDNNIIQKLWTYQFICQLWHFFINPVWKQMCGNCWPETGDQSIYFSHVYWETTYKLRLYLSCNSSQVWPTRISGVIESVFRCSGPNSKSIVTLTRPM